MGTKGVSHLGPMICLYKWHEKRGTGTPSLSLFPEYSPEDQGFLMISMATKKRDRINWTNLRERISGSILSATRIVHKKEEESAEKTRSYQKLKGGRRL